MWFHPISLNVGEIVAHSFTHQFITIWWICRRFKFIYSHPFRIPSMAQHCIFFWFFFFWYNLHYTLFTASLLLHINCERADQHFNHMEAQSHPIIGYDRGPRFCSFDHFVAFASASGACSPFWIILCTDPICIRHLSMEYVSSVWKLPNRRKVAYILSYCRHQEEGSQSPILRFNPHMNGLLELFGEKSINHAHSSFSHRLKIVLHFVDSIDLILSNAIFQSESHTQKSLTYWMGSKEFNIN